MKGVSLPKENIQVPDFVELGEVTPEGSSDIAKGESKDFTIKFKIKKDVPNEGIGTVKVKLKYEEDQCIIPSGEDSIIIEDKDPPNHVTGNVIPGSVNADEPQSVYINTVKTDDWSGIDTEQPVQINIEGLGTYAGTIKKGSNEKESVISATIQSPVQEGTYDVTISEIRDKAGNQDPPKKIGTLKVTKKPDSDREANPPRPDESLDLFGSIITGNKAPRFGPAKVAIFKSGYAVELSDMLATFGEAADYILPENFSPALASTYPILVIPSAGLANHTNNANLREKLTEYVENGGNLIVMTRLGSEK
jgi:hypothetical protein